MRYGKRVPEDMYDSVPPSGVGSLSCHDACVTNIICQQNKNVVVNRVPLVWSEYKSVFGKVICKVYSSPE